MIVVDASAVVAMIVGEPGSEELYRRMDQSRDRSISTVSVWEASCAVARLKSCNRELGLSLVREFLIGTGLRTVAPDDAITELAVEAAERYGRGAGYPGILNLGDCFSYATAKHLGAALLHKGDDFSRTDIPAA